MRCHICNSALSKPDYNSDLEGYEPCGTCLDVIWDAVGAWTDKPFASEDELGTDDTIEELTRMSVDQFMSDDFA